MPFQNQIHVDKLLSEISVKYKNSEYIGMDVFPKLQVKKDTDLYRSYVRDFRIPDTFRANGGEAKEHYFEVTTASYVLEKHALKDYVSDDDAQNYDIGSLRADVVEELTDVMQRRVEKSVADLFTTTNWSLNVSLAAANAFNANTTVSNPIPVFLTGATEIIGQSGKKPNFGILPRQGMVACQVHTSILDRIKYTSSEATAKMMAALFELEELLVPASQYDSSARGATEVIGDIWGDSAFLGWKPNRPSPMAPSCGYLFMNSDQKVKRWRVEERESEAIEVNMKFQPKVVASLTGFLIKDII